MTKSPKAHVSRIYKATGLLALKFGIDVHYGNAYLSQPLGRIEYVLHELSHAVTLGILDNTFEGSTCPLPEHLQALSNTISKAIDQVTYQVAILLELEAAALTYVVGKSLSVWSSPDYILERALHSVAHKNRTGYGNSTTLSTPALKEVFRARTEDHTILRHARWMHTILESAAARYGHLTLPQARKELARQGHTARY